MTDSHAFVVQLDHLIRLLAERPAELDDQKLALHQLRSALARGDVAIVATADGLTANGAREDGPPAEADGLRGRLLADGVRRLDVRQDASPDDLLVTARALATSGGLVWLDLAGVRVDASPSPALPTPIGIAAVVSGAPDDGREIVTRPTPAHVDLLVPPPRVSRPVPRPVPPQRPAAASPAAAPAGSAVAVVTASAPVRPNDGLLNRSAADGAAAVLLRPTPTHAERVRDTRALVEGIADLRDVREVTVVLEEVTGRVERASRDGDGATLRDAFAALVRQERAETRADVRLAVRIAIRRLVTPHGLRLVAALLPRQPERREETLDALRTELPIGADAVMEHLTTAESASDRRAFYAALRRLPADESVLVHMLGDPRWFVVRNAAELAGDLRLRGTEGALVGALAHADPRVHRAAAAALGRLATPAAVEALRGMLAAEDRQLRGFAAVALADAGWPHAAATLRTLLEEERDADARHALLAALGRVASEEAVEILTAWSARGRGLFRRTAPATRLAAVQALVDAGTDSARIALRTLARDGDRQVATCAQAGVVRARARARTREA